MAETEAGDAGPQEADERGGWRLTRREMEAAALAGRQVAGTIDRPTAMRVLREGEMTVVGRLLSASNATFFCLVQEHPADGSAGITASCVYKPTRGERPLSDFPDGTLACREVAAHAVAVASGWDLIPPTLLRDGPFGSGMVQLWMEVDEAIDLGEIIGRDLPALRHMAVLDAVLNNADRKGGHLLPLKDGRILGVDNGLCFAVEQTLRTVLWQWRGRPLNDEETAVLARLRTELNSGLGEELGRLLVPAEVRALLRRIDGLLTHRRFPMPDPNRPAIPWPPF
jgi:uncharacterized repeat protein (TIGR03843 family)